MRDQRGFSLAEALIALVVLSLGVVSASAMQLKALQSTQTGYQRSLASVAVIDAQERVWATYAAHQRCDDIAVAPIEAAWRRHWFSADTGLLESERAARSGLERQGCRFAVVIAPPSHESDENTLARYEFQLPVRALKAP